MPNRSSKKKKVKRAKTKKAKGEDENQLAASIVEQISEGDSKVKNAAAVALGRLGGKKGGPARAIKLSAQKRSEIAKKAAEARWKKK